MLPSSATGRHLGFLTGGPQAWLPMKTIMAIFIRAMQQLAFQFLTHIILAMAQLLQIHGRAMATPICHSFQPLQCLSSQEWLQDSSPRLQDSRRLLYSKYRAIVFMNIFLMEIYIGILSFKAYFESGRL